MNLKKIKKSEFLSLPGGAQQQTHQSQIFLSALIISKDTSHYYEEKGIKPCIWNSLELIVIPCLVVSAIGMDTADLYFFLSPFFFFALFL